jgi:Domain of unknown function (DUF4166)/Saccharopine dehydrogenase NADP binding domain
MSPDLTVLIVGGYGIFGGRLVQLLQNEPRLRLVVAGRSLARAAAYCSTLADARAVLVPAAFDRDEEPDRQLDTLRPDVVVDASGPFQAYGDKPYRLVQACIGRRMSYLDLADGSDFVAGIERFNADAIAAGVFVLSGVSSFPVLTAAVARQLSVDMVKVHAIRGGIAPSPYAGVGANVIRAIASYAGQPVALRREGRIVTAHPFTESLRYTIAPPGKTPLRPLRLSLVDVPDLKVLAELWPEARTIWMGAGPVPASLHWALTALAWLVRLRCIKSLLPFAPIMTLATNRLRWGEHRGGMFVEVTGEGATGVSIRRSWHLLAEGDDGPLIPSMAAAAIIHKVLDDNAPHPGARAAVRDLEVTDYEELFQGRQLYSGVREDNPVSLTTPLYARILGSAWDPLPVELKQLHAVKSTARFAGRGAVERGSGAFAGLIARAFGFPASGQDVEVSVNFDVRDGVETWTRTFNGKSFSSIQSEGRGASENLLCERFGPLNFAMALVCKRAQIHLVLRRWTAFGVPMPLWLGPQSTAHESVIDGKFRFDVEIGHPMVGLVVRYRGWLDPVDQKCHR